MQTWPLRGLCCAGYPPWLYNTLLTSSAPEPRALMPHSTAQLTGWQSGPSTAPRHAEPRESGVQGSGFSRASGKAAATWRRLGSTCVQQQQCKAMHPPCYSSAMLGVGVEDVPTGADPEGSRAQG